MTIEDVEILDRHTIAVLNDNNYPGTGGRGADVRDVNEYLEIDLGTKLDVDRRLLPRRVTALLRARAAMQQRRTSGALLLALATP